MRIFSVHPRVAAILRALIASVSATMLMAAAAGPARADGEPVGWTTPYRTQPLTLAGDAYVYGTLSPVYDGGWSDGTLSDTGITLTYSYLRCNSTGDDCVPIPGAALPNYQVTLDDVGHTVRAREVAQNSKGTSDPAVTEPSAVVVHAVPFPYADLGLFGKAVVGAQIGAYNGGWAGSTSYSESYLRCDAGGDACEVIAGEEGWTYTVRQEDIGHTLRVREYASNDVGNSVLQTTPPSAIVVAAAEPVPTPTVTPTASPIATPTPSPTPIVAPTPTLAPVVTAAPVATPVVTAPTTPTPAAAAGPTPTPSVAVPQLALSGRVLAIAGVVVRPTRPGHCPARATVSIRSGRTTIVRRFAVNAVASGCSVSGTVKLTGAAATAAALKVSVSGAKLRTAVKRVRRS